MVCKNPPSGFFTGPEMGRLNDQRIRAARASAEAEGKAVRLADGTPGLVARCNPGGRVAWEFVYKPRGSKTVQRVRIGAYPDISIRLARDYATELRLQRNRGVDPRQQRAAEAEAQRVAVLEAEQRLTLAQLIDRFLASKADLRWQRRYSEMLAYNVTPRFGSKPAVEFSAADINSILDDCRRRGSPVQAARVYEVIRAVMRWSLRREYIAKLPLAGVEPPAKGKPRERILSPAEIKNFWDRLDQTEMPVAHRQILRLELLLGQRSGEVAGMTRAELSGDGLTWTIPAARSKNAFEHKVPLPPLARGIVAAAAEASTDARFVFPSASGSAIRSDVIAHTLADAQGVFGFVDAEGRPSRFSAHDLRRTAASGMRQIGISSDTISAILNHISETRANVTGKHYLHDDRSMEMRVALTQWQAAIERILGGEDPIARKADDIAALEARMLGKRPVIAFRKRL